MFNIVPVIEKNGTSLMSSVDLAKLCVGEAKDAHSDFMKKARKVLGESLLGKFSEQQTYVKNQQGAKGVRTVLLLPERESCLMAMSYSYELQAYVFDQWQAIKDKAPRLPTTYAEALQLAADQAKQLELQAPAVAFVEKYVESTGNKTFREVAKILKISERKFRMWLVVSDIQYLLGRNWMAYQRHIDAGRFYVTTGEANGHAYTRCLFTPKGIEWISRLWEMEIAA